MSDLLTWADKKNSANLEEFIAKYGAEYCLTAEEINQMRDAVNEMAVIQQSVCLGPAEPTDTPAGTGANYWEVIVPGTYTNFGGMVLPSNNRGLIYRNAAGAFSISFSGLDLSGKLNVNDIIDEIYSHEVNKPASANSVRVAVESSVQIAKSDSDILIPDTSYSDILAENPSVVTTYENKFIDLNEPLGIGQHYRFKFKMLTQSNGGDRSYFTIHLRNADGTVVHQTVWNNFETIVGTPYIVDVVAVAASEKFFLYCGNFGGNIEISFEKIVSASSGMSVKFEKLLTPLKNKSIVWFGTSIPTGTDTVVNVEDYSGANKYPSMVASKTGANVYNEGLGGTRISTGIPSAYDESLDHLGIGNNIQASFGFYSALTHTLAEKDWIFDNWATIYTKFQDSGSLTSTCPKTKEQLRDYSFERKLVSKYLKSTATVANPNLYIINHDLNDMFKIWMDGGDTIPTANSATERMYFAGAVNYFIRKIYAADAKAQIIMITHYRKNEPDLDKMFDLVTAVAKYWSIPLIDLANNLQTARQIQTAGYWDAYFNWHDTGYTFVNNGDGTFTTNDYGPQRNWDLATYLANALPHQVISNEDISFVYPVGTWVRTDHRLNILCPDNVHPHSDLTGKSNMIIAKIISNEVKKYL